MSLPIPLMMLAEATEKHTQLKSLDRVMRSLFLEMRDRKGYLALGYESFEDYGYKEWGFSKSHVHRLAAAEEIQQSLSPIGDQEIPESQLRPLGKVPKAEREKIYQQAKAEAEQQGKDLTAKAVNDAVTKYLEQLNKAQTTLVGIESELQCATKQLEQQTQRIQHLENNANSEAEKIAAVKLAETQAEMQKQLDAQVAKVEAENQEKIDEQKDIIARLQNTIANTEKGDQAERRLQDVKEQIDRAHSVLRQLDIDKKEADAAKRANHAYVGIAQALASDAHDYIDNFNSISSLVDEQGNTIPLYPLTDYSKDYLKEVSKVLRNCAKFIDHLANYSEQPTIEIEELDAIDKSYHALVEFFIKWKQWAKENGNSGLNYDWWFSRLMEEKSTKLKKHLPNFEAVWERYQSEIRAIN